MKLAKRTKMAALLMAVIVGYGGTVNMASAAVVSTQQLSQQATVDSKRDRLSAMVSRDEVASQLTRLGVDPAVAQQRIANLSAEEIDLLHARIEELPAGAGALGTIAIVLVILILLDVAGVTDIFPKV